MYEVELIERQVELVAVSIEGRVRLIHELLHSLAFFTRSLFEVDVDPAIVDAWLAEEEFVVRDNGFFESAPRLARVLAHPRLVDEQAFCWSARCKDDREVRRRMYLLYRLRPYLVSMYPRLRGVAWIYFQDASVRHVATIFPAMDAASMIGEDFDWHEYHSFTVVAPVVNPERRIRASAPNVDYAGQGMISCVSVPVYRGDELLGVWTMDVRLAELHADLALEPIGGVAQRQTNFITDYAGTLIAHPRLNPAGSDAKGSVHRLGLDLLGGDYRTLDLAELVARGSGHLELVDDDGERRFVAYHTAPAIEWIVFTSFPTREMTDAANQAFERAFERLGAGDLSFRLDAAGSEVMRTLVGSYNTMADTLQETLRRREDAEAEKRRLEVEQERLGRELEIAATIQLAMLPERPTHAELEIAGRMRPAHEVGGDFYDVLTDGQRLWLTIGDVSSHGLGAGLVMMITQAAFQSAFEAGRELGAAEALRVVNRVIHATGTVRLGGKHYLTAQLMVYRGEGVFDCVGAHLWPILIDVATGRCRRVEVVGPWLGVLPELPSVPVHRLQVARGEVLCLYSDGLIEARDRGGAMLDLAGLEDVLGREVRAGGSLEDVAARVLAAIAAFAPEQDDDRTIVLLQRR